MAAGQRTSSPRLARPLRTTRQRHLARLRPLRRHLGLAARPRTPRDKATASLHPLGAGAASPPPLRPRRPGRCSHHRAAIARERPTVPEAAGLPRQRVGRTGCAGSDGASAPTVLARTLQDGEGSHRPPPRAGGPPLQRASRARQLGTGDASASPQCGVAAARPARGRPQRALQRLHHGGGPHARCPPRPLGMDASASDRLGATHRHGLRRTHHPAAADLQASQARPPEPESCERGWNATVDWNASDGPRSECLTPS